MPLFKKTRAMSANSKVRLTFNCPVDLDSMPCSDNGKFCTQCSKNVTDFRGKDVILIDNPEEEACGRFDIYQVENPFNNWKDKFVRFSARMNNVNSRFRTVKHVAFALSISSLFLIGCSRHRGVAGAYAYGNYDSKNENRKEVKQQEKDKSKKTIRQSR